MKKLYLSLLLPILLSAIHVFGQTCDSLTTTYHTYESRCAATGSIKVNASGGSGNYTYMLTGPVNSNYTTTDSITGLSSGTYTLFVHDVTNSCTDTITNVVVNGNYQDPRFTLVKQDVTCDNGNNGSITVTGQLFGLAPFTYMIVAPSTGSIGTVSTTGTFSDLAAGNYSIRLMDSCGGIQTRQITVGNYTWWIDSYSFDKTGCDEASGYIKVYDSQGNISTVSGIPGFTYGIVRAPGDTIWSSDPTFVFPLGGHTNFQVIVRDNCGLIKTANSSVTLIPVTASTVNSYNYLCNSFSVSLAIDNFFGPQFCLYDASNILIGCNATGTFTGLPYGSYCMNVHDSCTDTTITRCFTAVPPLLTVAAQVLVKDKTCTDFTAMITGQVGLTNPDYCLYNEFDNVISCNTTGIFTNLHYGTYCIKTKDNCRDTTITRCFTAMPPTPVFPAVILPSYITCTDFGIVVAGDSVSNPIYCLYDTLGHVITCNSTGIFDSIPFGHYCVSVHDACTDTTITRCFSVMESAAVNNIVKNIFNQTCTGFDVSFSSPTYHQPEWCLYTDNGQFISCDSSGTFTNLPYGNYCVFVKIICPDTTIKTCFSVTQPLPVVAATVSTHHYSCTKFSATVGTVSNFSNPLYCLFDANDVQVECNNTGQFVNIPYGQYCIKITSDCYDTVITRCFTKTAPVVDITGSATRSCALGFAKFNLNMGGGTLPVQVIIYKPDGTVLLDTSYNSNSIQVDSIPGITTGNFYKIVAIDYCGNSDTLLLSAPASYFNHIPEVVPKCPGSGWANGSGDIKITVSTNLGALTIRIIKKNGLAYSPALQPNTVLAGVFTFNDLGPGTYILSSSENSCNKKFYDTISIQPYQFPNLSRSSAYQCDVNGFSVSAVATGGVPPYTYEIIGSIPAFPSIVSGPQSSPIFNINNGTTYSLIRLRALDACGNATLGDASILPLAMNGISVTANCFSLPSTLSVDPIYNATYSWYKKTSPGATDSVFLGNGTSYFIPEVTLYEVGWFFCYVNVNNGCIQRAYNFHVTGLCFYVLPVKLETFKGANEGRSNLLTWKASGESTLLNYTLERMNDAGQFERLGKVDPVHSDAGKHTYNFRDEHPLNGSNHYRLKMINTDGSFGYSNIVILKNKADVQFVLYPNPVQDVLTISIHATGKKQYRLTLSSVVGQPVYTTDITVEGNGKINVPRVPSITKGIYFITITNRDDRSVHTEKVVYL